MNIDLDDKDLLVSINPPTLYDINRSFDHISNGVYSGIVGEEEARMVVFTNFILGEKPVILKGSRSSGKSNTIKVVSAYAKNPIEIASSSEKANQRNINLNNHSHFVVPEINKVNEKTIEMLKDFGEGANHQYSFTNPYKEVETIIISPKPFITSIADENKNVDALGEELVSRLTVVRTDSSINQNVRVINEKLTRAKNPFLKKEFDQNKINSYINYVKSLPSISSYKFIYPAGETVQKAIPPLFTDSRRDVEKYLSNTYGITMFHFPERMTIERDGKKYLFVTPEDMWLNHVIYQNVLLESSLKCGVIEREIINFLQDDVSRKDEYGTVIKGYKISEIHTHLLKRSYTPTIDSVTKMCNQLTEIGYLSRNEEVKPYRYSLNPELSREYSVDIDWKEIVEACKNNMNNYFPEQAQEYISKYCVNIVVTHPFTGEKIDILESKILKQESIIKKDVSVVQEFSFDEEDVEDKIKSYCSELRSYEDIKNSIYVDDSKLQTTIDYLVKTGYLIEPRSGFYKTL